MGCSSCSGNNRVTVHQVILANGDTREYLTEVEARTAANQLNGTYSPITR